jgi:hypothetical protein
MSLLIELTDPQRRVDEQLGRALAAEPHRLRDVRLSPDLGANPHHLLRQRRQLLELLQCRLELDPLAQPVARVDGFDDVRSTRRRQVLALIELQRVELPRLARGRDVKPAFPAIAIAIGLALEELQPRMRTGVLGVLVADVLDVANDLLDELEVLPGVEIELVADEPSWGLIARLFALGPGGS